MFFDDPQRKSASFRKNTKATTTAPDLLRAQINSGLKNIQLGLKDDLTKSLSRLLPSNRQTKPNVKTNSNKSKSNNTSNKNKSEPGKLSLRQNNTAINGGESKFLAFADRQGRMQSFSNSLETRAKWVPEPLRASLRRSFSTNHQAKLERTPSGSWRSRLKTLEHHTKSPNNGDQLLETKRRLKCEISNLVNKYDSWLNNSSKTSPTTILFIITNVLLLTLSLNLADGAPLPAGDVVQPIWLRDGLITLDTPTSMDADTDAPPLSILKPNSVDVNSLEQMLMNLEIPTSESQAPVLYEDNAHQQRVGLSGPLDRYTGALKPVIPPEEELLWIQRRRLNRDRALEPPPWSRNRPMRRGFNPAMQDISNNNDRSSIEDGFFEDDPYRVQASGKTQWFRPVRGRQSRQSTDQIYEEILKHLIDGALNSKTLIDDLHSELEMRTNQQPMKSSLSSPQQTKNLPSTNSGTMQQPAVTAQQQTAHAGEIIQDPFGSPQDTDLDSTLVVVGDEVSSGDDVTPLENSHLPLKTAMNAAYSQSGGPTYGSIQNNGEKLSADDVNSMVTLLIPVTDSPINVVTNGGLYVVRPETPDLAQSSSIDLSNDDPDSQQSVPLQNYRPIPLLSSFHVVEDIDQADNSQDALAQPATALDNDDSQLQQQQQQFEEKTDWVGKTSEPIPAEKRTITREFETLRKPGKNPLLLERNAALLARHTQFPAEQYVSDSVATHSDLPVKHYPMQTNSSARDLEAIMMIESGYLSRDQLVQAATKLKSYLEDIIRLPRASILGLYPMNAEQLLVKLDTSKLSAYQMVNMIQNYDFARGFIVVSWPRGSKQSPLPILTAILRVMGKVNLERNENNVQLDDIQLVSRADQQQQLQQPPLLSNKYRANYEPNINPLNGGNQLNKPILFNEQQQLAMPGYQFANYEVSGSEIDDDEVDVRQLLSPSQYMLQPAAALNPTANIPSANDRMSLAVLTAYLNNLYPNDQANSWHMLKAPLAGLALPVSSFSGDGGDNSSVKRSTGYDLLHSWHLLHLVALVAALLGALFLVKFVIHSPDKRFLIRQRFDSVRSLWPSVTSTLSGTSVVGSGDKQSKLESDNLTRHHSDDSIIVDEGDKKTLDLLTQKLVNLLNRRPARNEKVSEKVVNNNKEIDEASVTTDELEFPDDDTEAGQPKRFRTSRSYIKSLIDVLSKARSQFPSSRLNQTAADYDDDNEQASTLIPKQKSSSITEETSSQMGELDEQQEPGILMSQMDISAAHLILAYMEKHLEDKEQLRREWQELNAGGVSSSTKVTQLMLERLAKVALSEENRFKNRNCLVVPFDRNRVKLGSHGGSYATAGASAAPVKAYVGLRRRSGGSSTKADTTKSDYINASYIYDDDPRRPTHIIAQGPSEQTIGQFWQMVWEQGISVIVMLTRLNENSIRMCHCYWPTNNTSNSGSGSGGTSGQVLPSGTNGGSTPSSDDGTTNGTGNSPKQHQMGAELATMPTVSNGNGSVPSSTANGRRGSVTSVFNTTGARHNGNGLPIIANGDLSNNILCFDVSHSSLDEEAESQVEAQSESESKSNLLSKSIPSSLASPASCASTFSTITCTSATFASSSLFTSAYTSAGYTPTGASSSASTTSASASANKTRFEVHLVSEHVSSNDYLVRNMYMINRSTGETRTITQFHYLAWPEGGVPDNVKSFLHFRRKVHKSYRNLKSPILVHCSDGAGRSGTYTLIDTILERIRNGAKEIDPRATLEHLRDQRPGLCATQSQFQFVLVALAEEIQIILNALPQ